MKNIFFLMLAIVTVAIQAQEKNPPIHVKVTGKGAPVMLIPGFTVPGESWNTTVSKLEKNYECHTVTLAGFGGTAPIVFPWLPKVNEALEEYINENQLSGLTVIGHSLGGTIATWLASRENSPISKLILVDALPAAGALMIPDFNPENLVYDSPFNNRQLAMTQPEFQQMAAGMAQGMSLKEESQKMIAEWILMADRKTYVYGYTDYLKLDTRKALKRISVPVLILAADQPFGKERVAQTYKTQYANLLDYDLVIAENAAHFVMFDQQEWFLEQILGFLSSS